MTELTLSNLVAWAAQVAILTAVAALVARLIPIDAPAVRYAWWRVVLLAALVLPVVQPWQPPGLLPTDLLPVSAPLPVETIAPGPLAVTSPSTPAVRPPTRLQPTAVVAGTLLAGVLLRLAWLLVGLVRLRRLRGAGTRAVVSGAPDTLRAIEEAGAEVRYVAGLRQPVTFGIRRPVVLLPASLPDLAPPIQRAVLVHELWHVRRGDWTWTLLEEGLRAVLWFHPAVWYLVSRVQAAREEVVDELSVLATNARRSYLEALLVFADEPSVYPAASFARRCHLFTRMLLISREAVMSSRRIVCSGAAMAAAIVFTGWYGSLAFPLTAAGDAALARPIAPPARLAAPAARTAVPAAPPQAGAVAAATTVAQQAPPRDPRPAVARPETSREQEIQAALRGDPTSVQNWVTLARMQQERGAYDEAETTLTAALAATQRREVLMELAGFYNRRGNFEKSIATLEDAAARDAADPAGHQLVAVYYWEKAQRDTSLTPQDKRHYIDLGIAAADRALALKPDYIEALTYKNILLRMQGNLETDLARRQALFAEADTLRNRAMALGKSRPPQVRAPGDPSAPPPPPPPPPPAEWQMVDGQPPLRVGGNIKTPTKIHDVRPIYPAEAFQARVSGLVIIEALIDREGNVSNARVLRSIPLLDQAALDAVRGWRFTPTEVDGVAVPVIMTVTVNFTVQ